MDPEQASDAAAQPLPNSRRLMLWEVEELQSRWRDISGPTPNGIRVAWSTRHLRIGCKGFAGACVAALSQKLLDDGRKYCFLYTDLGNPISNHVYQKIGYEPVTDATVYSFS